MLLAWFGKTQYGAEPSGFSRIKMDAVYFTLTFGSENMKILSLLLSLLSRLTPTVAPNQFALEGAWLGTNSKWIDEPRDVEPHE
jgi:hypothetical protein